MPIHFTNDGSAKNRLCSAEFRTHENPSPLTRLEYTYESLQPQMERGDAVRTMLEACQRSPPSLFLLFKCLWYQADVDCKRKLATATRADEFHDLSGLSRI